MKTAKIWQIEDKPRNCVYLISKLGTRYFSAFLDRSRADGALEYVGVFTHRKHAIWASEFLAEQPID